MKRLLSVILAVCIVSGCLNVFADAQPDGSDISFMTAFGFVSPDVNGEDAVTRLDLAKVYYAIAGNISASSAESKFSDVSSGDAGVVNFVSDMGIMVGGGDGKFNPSDKLTFAQFIKTVVTFLGYGDYALADGGYPYGYIIRAERLGIIQSYPQNENDYVTWALVASVFKLASDVRTTYTLNGEYHLDFNYLKKFRNINTVSGVLQADNVTDIGDADISPDYDEVVIDSKLYKLTDYSFSLKTCVGKSMQVYYDNDDNIIWYEEYDNKIKKIDGENITSVSRKGNNIVIEYEAGNKVSDLKLSNGIYVVYNGSVLESFTDELYSAVMDEMRESSVEVVDNNSDGSYDVLFIDVYESYIAKASINGTVYTKDSNIISVEDFEEGDIPVLNLSGKYLPLDSVAEGDVVNVFRDFDGKVNKIVVTIDTYTGTITELSVSERSVVIDNNRFELSGSVCGKKDFDKFKPGAKIKAYFNMDGEVCDFEIAQETELRFGYIIAGSNKSSSLEETYKLKIFSESGSIIEAELSDKVIINGSKKLDAKDAWELAGFTDGLINRQMIIYRTDRQSGEIDTIYYCSGTESCDGLYMYEGFDGVTVRTDYPYKTSSMSFGGRLLVNSGTVVFSVPTESNRNDTDMYQIKTVSVIKNDDTSTLFEAYGTEENCPVAGALVIKKNLKDAEDLDDNMIVVESVSTRNDANGDTIHVVKGICNGAWVEYVFEEGSLNGIKKGDVIFPMAQKGNGVWGSARLIYGKNSLSGSNPTGKYTADVRFCFGKVIFKGEGYISVEIESANGDITVEHFNTSRFKMAEFNSSSRDGVLSVAGEERIFDSEHYGDSASYVLIHTRRGDAKSMVIYNIM